MPEDSAIVKIDTKPLADVANKLIDKVSQGIGWVCTPKGVWKDHVEAKEAFIEGINNNQKLSPFQKAAFISDSKRLIRQYKNQNDIFQMAVEQLDDKAQPDKVDDDWLSHFFEEAKHVSQENVKLIWGKLLANECEEPGSIPKSLIQTISYMGVDLAKKFNIICNFALDQINSNTLQIARCPQPLIMWSVYRNYYENFGIKFPDLVELQSAGLLQFSDVSTLTFTAKNVIFNYFEKSFIVKSNDDKVSYGQILFTNAGQALCKAISLDKQADFLQMCYDYWKKEGCEVILLSNSVEK
jgi:hypothetical protein